MSNKIEQQTERLQDYFKLKSQFLNIPFKVGLYLGNLEQLIEGIKMQELPEYFSESYQNFLIAFQKQSMIQKIDYLLKFIKFLKHFQQNFENGKILLEEIVNTDTIQDIQTQCYLKQTVWGLPTWNKYSFKFNLYHRLIKLDGKKQGDQIYLKSYFVRQSRTEENSLVFDSIDETIPEKYKRIAIKFKNESIFKEVYYHVRSCTIDSIYRQHCKDLFNISQYISVEIENQGFQPAGGKFSIFNEEVLKDGFFKIKKKIKGIQQNKNRFKFLCQIRGCKLYKKRKNIHFYKIEKKSAFNLEQTCEKINLMSSQLNNRVIKYEKIQKITSQLSIDYFKYLIKGKPNETLCILEKEAYCNIRSILVYGLKTCRIKKSIEMLEIIVEQDTRSKTCVVTIYASIKLVENMQLGPLNTFDFLLSLINFQEDLSLNNTIIINKISSKIEMEEVQDDQDQFHTVLNDSFEKDDFLFEDNHPSNGKNADNQSKNNSFINNEDYQEQNDKIDEEFQKQNDFNDKIENKGDFSKKIGKTENIMGLANEGYLKKKFQINTIPLAQRIKEAERVKQHYLFQNWKRAEKGGVVCINEEVLTEQKKTLKIIFAKMGTTLLQGKNIMNFSFPVEIFKAESSLTSIAQNLSFAPTIFDSSDMDYSVDPLKRMNKSLIFSILMTISGISMKKPFNPILGETYNATADGCQIFLEQICHHPPLSAFYMKGRGYTVYGVIEPKVSLGLNSIEGYSPQINRIVFDDGGKINFTIGKMKINGVVFGQRMFNFESTNYLFDEANLLVTEVVYGPRKGSFLAKNNDPKDYVSGNICKVSQKFMSKFIKENYELSPLKDEDSVVLSTFSGVWSGSFFIDGELACDFVNIYPHKLELEEYPLPSDSSLREDIIKLANNQIAQSQKQKEKLQELQRRDKKLRMKYQKSKPR